MTDKYINRPSAMAVGLARELYNKFVMGGWEPQDAHQLIDDILDSARDEEIKEPCEEYPDNGPTDPWETSGPGGNVGPV